MVSPYLNRPIRTEQQARRAQTMAIFNITAVSNFGEIDTLTTDDVIAARFFFEDMFTLAFNSVADGTRGFVDVKVRITAD